MAPSFFHSLGSRGCERCRPGKVQRRCGRSKKFNAWSRPGKGRSQGSSRKVMAEPQGCHASWQVWEAVEAWKAFCAVLHAEGPAGRCRAWIGSQGLWQALPGPCAGRSMARPGAPQKPLTAAVRLLHRLCANCLCATWSMVSSGKRVMDRWPSRSIHKLSTGTGVAVAAFSGPPAAAVRRAAGP